MQLERIWVAMDTEPCVFLFLSSLNFLSSAFNFSLGCFILNKTCFFCFCFCFFFTSSKACIACAECIFHVPSPSAFSLCQYSRPLWNPTESYPNPNSYQPQSITLGSLKNSYLSKHKEVRGYTNSNQRLQRFSKTAATPNTLFHLSPKLHLSGHVCWFGV